MADKSYLNSVNEGDSKNIKINVSPKVPADSAFSSESNKCSAVGEQKSSTSEKRLEQTSKEPIKIKSETDVLIDMINVFPNMPASLLKIPSLRSPAMIAIKKENDIETLLELPTYNATPMTPATLLNLQSADENSDKSGNQAVSDYSKKQGVIESLFKDILDEEIKITPKVPADNVFSLDDNKCSAIGEQQSSTCEKGLEETSNQPIKIKCETDVLNDMINALPNVSTSPIKISSLRSPDLITIKKKNDRETALKLTTYKGSPIIPAMPLNLQSVDENSDQSGNQAVSNSSKKQGVISLALKGISDEERKKLRAKRFNIIDADTPKNNKVIAKTVPNRAFDKTTFIANKPTPTYDTLKKRAERFGEHVSSVMKSLDNKEKLLKRKLKFLESVTTSKEIEVKKKIRMV